MIAPAGCRASLHGLTAQSTFVQFPDICWHLLNIPIIRFGVINICPSFWTVTSDIQKIVLIMEASEWTDVGGTHMHEYAWSDWACQILAQQHPEKAVGNSPTYGRFAYSIGEYHWAPSLKSSLYRNPFGLLPSRQGTQNGKVMWVLSETIERQLDAPFLYKPWTFSVASCEQEVG